MNSVIIYYDKDQKISAYRSAKKLTNKGYIIYKESDNCIELRK